jgi:hypothetical protein
MQINLDGGEIQKAALEKAKAIAESIARSQIEDHFNSGQYGNHIKGTGYIFVQRTVQEVLHSQELKDLIHDRVVHFLVKHADECTEDLVKREIRKLGHRTLSSVEKAAT